MDETKAGQEAGAGPGRGRIRDAVLGTADANDAARRLAKDCDHGEHGADEYACWQCVAEALFILDETHAADVRIALETFASPPHLRATLPLMAWVRKLHKTAIDCAEASIGVVADPDCPECDSPLWEHREDCALAIALAQPDPATEVPARPAPPALSTPRSDK